MGSPAHSGAEFTSDAAYRMRASHRYAKATRAARDQHDLGRQRGTTPLAGMPRAVHLGDQRACRRRWAASAHAKGPGDSPA